MSPEETTKRTFHNELWRALPTGVLETLSTTFGMLIAVRVFQLQDLAKSIFLASSSAGLMISLFAVPLLLRTRSTLPATAARIQFVGAAFVTLSAWQTDSPFFYLMGLSVGMFCATMQIPLLTQIYQTNYPPKNRGSLFAITGTLRAAVAMGFGFLGGWLLKQDLENYRWLLGLFAANAVINGLLTLRLPAVSWQPPPRQEARSLWHALRWVKQDADFRILLISWMLVGIGNLIAVSLLVEYLANPRHGIDLPEHQITWIIGIVPVICRLIFSYPWGILYDRFNFFALRATLNAVFAAAILTFFLSTTITGWTIGMALFGIANAGGNVTWSLWVTKLAPPHAVAEYMSVHTFLTGLRGIVSPFIAFFLIQHFSFSSIGIGCAIATLAGSAILAGGSSSGKERL